MNITDKFSRKLRDVRISVTDRCNFRCSYCMPKEIYDSNYKFFRKTEILSFEEIIRLTKILALLGVKKVRLTGGEPLLRKNIHLLISHLKEIRGITDISMTTNGVLLTEKKAKLLKGSGLNRLTVSLDTLNPENFHKISGSKYSPLDVLSGIDNAKNAGFQNIKVNMVVKKNVNHEDIIPMLDNFKNTGPLGGIEAGLSVSNNLNNIILSCDNPLLTWEVIDYIISNYSENEIVFSKKEFTHPFPSYFNSSIRAELITHIKNGIRKITHLEEHFNVLNLDCSRFSENNFINFNCLEDIALFHENNT